MTEAAEVTTDTKALLRYEASKKSAGVAYLLWFFLGTLGAHRFYTGRTGSGVMQLVLCILGWLTLLIGVGIFLLGALGVWLLVDLFLVGGWVRAHNQKILTQLGV